MFQGRFKHTMDEKGRLAIPASFRKRLGGESAEGTVTVTIFDQCLAVYPQADWTCKLEALAKANPFDPKVMAFKRVFVGCAQECPIDKAGRILVPADLRQDAGIDRDCIVLGQLDKFEIWSAERWQRSFETLADQMGTICGTLAASGIAI